MKLPCLLVVGNRRLHAALICRSFRARLTGCGRGIKDAIAMAKKVAEQVANGNGHHVATVTTADHGNACQSGKTYA